LAAPENVRYRGNSLLDNEMERPQKIGINDRADQLRLT
jgi:hypothetical protein